MPKYTKAVKNICVQETLLFEGPLSGAPYPYRKAKETQRYWSLARAHDDESINDNAVKQDGGNTPANR